MPVSKSKVLAGKRKRADADDEAGGAKGAKRAKAVTKCKKEAPAKSAKREEKDAKAAGKTAEVPSDAPLSQRRVNLPALYAALGRPFARAGKQAVIDLAAGAEGVRFSRQGGMLRWQNAAMLWVNLCPEKPGKYTNTFMRRGRGGISFSFFAAGNMNPDHVIVRQILRSRVPGGSGEEAETSVLLVCRWPGEPYVFFGRLGLEAEDLTARPIAFSFRLLDAPELVKRLPRVRELLK